MIHSWIPLAHHFVNCALAILGLPCSHGFSQHPESHPKSPAASKTMKPWPGRLLCPGLSTVSWPATDFQTFHYYFFTYQAFDSGFYLVPVLKIGCSSLCCLVLPSSSPLWYFSHFWKHILPMITKPHPYADILLQQSISWDLLPCILTFPRCIESLRVACRLASCGFSLLLLTRHPNAFTTCE